MTEDAAARTTRSRVSTGVLVGAGQVAMNGAAYAFSLLAARLLIPAEFGVVTALLSILQMGSVASLGLQAATARRIAVDPAEPGATIGIVLRSTMYVSTACALAVGVATPVLMLALHLDSPWPVLLCAATLLPLTAMGGFIGIAQGLERWGMVTTLSVANGTGRLLAGTVALLIAPTVTSAMIGVAVGAWVPVVIGTAAFGRRGAGTHTRRPLVREALLGTHALFAFYVLSNLDAIIARGLLSEHEAGLYAAGLIIAKVALMGPSFVGILLYPRFARDATHRSRNLAVAVVVVLAVVGTAGTALLPQLALALAGGRQYAAVSENLWLFALEGATLAIVQVLVLDSLARRRRHLTPPLWGVAAAVPAVAILGGVGVTGLVTTVIGAALAAAVLILATDRPIT